ncbi:MAG: hypothetical protein ACXAC7_00415 [Candidatus Hodarchaeales archaeon]|jgi:hypothetical protein
MEELTFVKIIAFITEQEDLISGFTQNWNKFIFNTFEILITGLGIGLILLIGLVQYLSIIHILVSIIQKLIFNSYRSTRKIIKGSLALGISNLPLIFLGYPIFYPIVNLLSISYNVFVST